MKKLILLFILFFMIGVSAFAGFEDLDLEELGTTANGTVFFIANNSVKCDCSNKLISYSLLQLSEVTDITLVSKYQADLASNILYPYIIAYDKAGNVFKEGQMPEMKISGMDKETIIYAGLKKAISYYNRTCK